jgi:hypothetical protein
MEPSEKTKEVSYKRWKIDSEKARKPFIADHIKLFLASDLARPKTFSEIWHYMEEGGKKKRKICSKLSLVVYLDGLMERGRVVKVPYAKKRFKYALSDWRDFHELGKKLKGMFTLDGHVDDFMQDVRKGRLDEVEVYNKLLLYLTNLEVRQFESMTWLIKNVESKPLLIYILFDAIFRELLPQASTLAFLLIMVCRRNEKYREVVGNVMEILAMQKERSRRELLTVVTETEFKVIKQLNDELDAVKKEVDNLLKKRH